MLSPEESQDNLLSSYLAYSHLDCVRYKVKQRITIIYILIVSEKLVEGLLAVHTLKISESCTE